MNTKTILITALMLSSLFWLGNADRTYDSITCNLGRLYPGMPIYFCMNPDGSMDHSWFIYQVREMDIYYTTGGVTTTLTAGKKHLTN